MAPNINKICLLSYNQSSQSNMLKPEMALEYTYDVNKHPGRVHNYNKENCYSYIL